MKKNATIHGIERQRVLPPIHAIRNSNVYAVAPRPASEIGHVFDISDVRNPRQVAAIQACRGSHTHSLVTDPDDPDHVYVFIQGTSRVRDAAELPGCSGASPEEDPNTSLFRIEVVRIPVAAPERAELVRS